MAGPVQAQIRPDATLPNPSTVERTAAGNRIEGGTRSGNNLFHSFREFSVPTGDAAWFNNPTDIETIFTRVTGNSASQIDGLIRANGAANLFLLNPNGILFGPNARLDLGGSFVGSTASAVRFRDGFEFAASDTTTPLLTVSAPVGLRLTRSGPIRSGPNQAGPNQAGPIQLSGAGNPTLIPADPGLAVQPGRSLILVGNGLTLDGAVVTAGRLDLLSVATGEVSLITTPGGFRLGKVEPGALRDIELYNRATLWNPTLTDLPQGGIHLQGRRIGLNNSQIAGATLSQADAGQITLNASETVQLNGYNPLLAPPGSWIGSQVAPGASGDGGGIRINTPRLLMTESGQIQTLTAGSGAAGDIRVTADSIHIDGRSAALAAGVNSPDGVVRNGLIGSATLANGDGGDLAIRTQRLTLQNGGSLNTFVGIDSNGQGGDIRVQADRIRATGIDLDTRAVSGIIASTYGSGNSGSITVTTRQLRMDGGPAISTYVYNSPQNRVAASGDAGDVLVRASDLIELGEANLILPDQSTVIASITFGSGDGGDVTIETRRLRLLNGNSVATGVVRSLAFIGELLPNAGTGTGGNLRVTATEQIEVNGVNPLLGTPSNLGSFSFGPGPSGAVEVNTPELWVRAGGAVVSSAHETGDAGRLTVNAERVLVTGRAATGRGSTLGASAVVLDQASRQAYFLPPFPTGDTGEITINANQLEVLDGAELSARHEGQGNAGQLRVRANQLRLDNEGRIIAATSSGQGGNIQIQADQVLMRQQGQITAEAGGTGNGGNVAIESPLIVATGNSDIIANAERGRGGTIQIAAQGILGSAVQPSLTPTSDITASSELGAEFSGTVDLRTPEVKPGQGIVELPETVIDPSTQISTACRAATNNRFVVTGRGGIPTDPNRELNQGSSWADLRDLNQFRQRSTQLPQRQTHPEAVSQPAPRQNPLIEASGWRLNASGQRELVATAAISQPAFQASSCAQTTPADR
ncbi:MAG: filamentous hemagglutinin N-terminal domain-containing protein [Elainella sp.]